MPSLKLHNLRIDQKGSEIRRRKRKTRKSEIDRARIATANHKK